MQRAYRQTIEQTERRNGGYKSRGMRWGWAEDATKETNNGRNGQWRMEISVKMAGNCKMYLWFSLSSNLHVNKRDYANEARGNSLRETTSPFRSKKIRMNNKQAAQKPLGATTSYVRQTNKKLMKCFSRSQYHINMFTWLKPLCCYATDTTTNPITFCQLVPQPVLCNRNQYYVIEALHWWKAIDRQSDILTCKQG